MRRHRLVSLTIAITTSALLLLTACSDGTSGEPGPTSSEGTFGPGAGAEEDRAATESRFSADNCGTEVNVEGAPERIVTVKSTMTQLVVALGAADRIVGMAYQDGEVAVEDQLGSGEIAAGREVDVASILAQVPDLGERMPSHEAVLSVAPDLVLAGWESTFAGDAAGTRESFADLGIATFVAPAACTEEAYAPNPLAWDDVFGEIDQIGALLDLAPEADLVSTYLREALASLESEIAEERSTAPDDQPTALWWSSATDTPFVGAGAGAPQLIMQTVGLTNIAAELEGGWGPFSWEAAAAADPDYLVLVDATWNTAEQKMEFLASHPVASQMSAVQEENYLVIPFATSEAGIGTVEAAWLLHEQLPEPAGP